MKIGSPHRHPPMIALEQRDKNARLPRVRRRRRVRCGRGSAGYIQGVRYALPQPFLDLEHTADAGVEVEGGTGQEALARLVLALAALLGGGQVATGGRDEVFEVSSEPGLEGVAVALLRELLFRFATERVLPVACEVLQLSPEQARVMVSLAPYDPHLHAEGLDIKAVTRHEALLGCDTSGRWRGRILFDI